MEVVLGTCGGVTVVGVDPLDLQIGIVLAEVVVVERLLGKEG